ncbi:MAG: cobalamin-dependent protein [Deltaproteobacteria bacterium]|jgi:radical SAM superfamily enzyme YgiQ (UPF0313 family)|nr:cobalamin-dependent protein [Deltaproteobacteria bacterium]
MRVMMVSGSRARLPDPVYPLGAAIVATAARRAGHEVSWFDALRHEDPPAALAAAVEAERPQAVLFSIRNIDNAAFPLVDRHFEEHASLVEACRATTTAPVVLGGSGFSLMPEGFMGYLGADHGVVGEGEEAIVDVLAALEAREDVPRLVLAGRVRPPFPLADRDLFDADWYYAHGGVANLQSKRGCPLRCVYCTYPLLEGHSTRASEPGAVVDEMAALAAAGIGHVFFVDAVFNRPEEHAAMNCEEILRRELTISFTGYFVPTGELPEFPSLLRRAGCSAVELGTDSLSDPQLEALAKGFTVDEALAFSARLAAAGIKQCHNLIFGVPGETRESMEASVARMDAIDPTAVIATIGLRVYPGTGLLALAGGDEPGLDPVFFVEEGVAEDIVDVVRGYVETRRGWICPGLGEKMNPRYLARLRRRHKGPLWELF